jgi:diguanylate cyclase (GGDEF)-like protein
MLDISDQKHLESELAHQASHDPLTGLPNRRLFTDRLTAAIARSNRSGRPLALVFLDLDDFKTVNDTLGHDAGDALLIEVARRIGIVLRAGDTAARMGGDEFVVLLEDLDRKDQASDIVARLLEQIAGTYDLASRPIGMTTSAGATVLGAAGATAEDMLREADMALYESKARGKACQTWFEELEAKTA